MTLTAFPNGVSSFGVPIIGAGPVLTTGTVFFVDSGSSTKSDSASWGTDPAQPFATLDYAIGRCTANKGDTIIVMPNHAETITGIGGIAADIAGITIIGLGTYNQRPRFLMDGATTVTMTVTAADVTVRNLVFASGHAAVVRCINVTAAGLWVDRCEFVDNTTSENFLSAIGASSTTDGAASGLKVTDCRFLTAEAGALAMVLTAADISDLVMQRNVYISEGTGLATLVTCATGKDLKFCDIQWNFLSSKATAGNLFISNDTASPNNSGIIAHNRCGHADVTGASTQGAVGGCRFFDNLSTSADTLSGAVEPVVDTPLT